MRIVLHVDFDSFYASLEERRKEIKGKPVVICMFSGRSAESGAVATANYMARAMGIKAGMPIAHAKSLAADAVFLQADLEYYRIVSDEIMSVLREHAKKFEQRSIDEAYMDVSDGYKEAEELAKRIKEQVKVVFGITCSVGIGPNKLIAKMASRVRKPDGLTVVKPEEVEGFISPMNVDRIHGVGGVTAASLNSMGVKTIADLSKLDLQTLIGNFGETKSVFLYNASRGVDESTVAETERRQYSRMATLKTDTRDIEKIWETMDRMVDALHQKIAKNNVWFRTVSIIAITNGVQLHTRSRTLPAETNNKEAIKENCYEILKEFLGNNSVILRRCGVRVSSLGGKKQQSLMEFE